MPVIFDHMCDLTAPTAYAVVFLSLASSAADAVSEPGTVPERSVVAVSELLATQDDWESKECNAVYLVKDKDGNYTVTNYDKKVSVNSVATFRSPSQCETISLAPV